MSGKGMSRTIFNGVTSFFKRNSNMKAVKKGKVSPNEAVPNHIKKPEYALSGKVADSPPTILLYSPEEIVRIRRSAMLARDMLDFACALAKPGVTTDDIDRLTMREIVHNGAYPSPINYAGFPKSICTSVNEVICHGIPDDRPLEEGDILSIDVSVYLDGFHGDNCGTVIVGQGDDQAKRLVETNQRALQKAIEVCYPNRCLSEIGAVIQETAEAEGFRVVRHFCGHGVGPLMHMQPLVLHYRNNQRLKLRSGMVFTIEPILVEGRDALTVWDDQWSAVTVDGSRGSQFEHQILITDHGPEILSVSSTKK